MSIEKKITASVKQLDESLKEKVLEYINSSAESKGIKLKPDVLELEYIGAEIFKVADKYDIIKAGIFGSYARGEANSESDIDLLLEFNGVIGLMKLGNLKLENVNINCPLKQKRSKTLLAPYFLICKPFSISNSDKSLGTAACWFSATMASNISPR